MDLGSSKFEWFPFVPTYKGNRDLPQEEQLRLEVRRMRPLDRTDQIGWTQEGVMDAWRDQRLQKHLQDDEVAPILRRVPPGVLIRLRQFVENTRAFTNFVVDGAAQTDPVELFFHLSADMLVEDSLINEINDAIVRASALSGDELKNFKEQCAGLKPPTSTAPTAPLEASPMLAATLSDEGVSVEST